MEVIEISLCFTEKENRAIKTVKEEEEEQGTPIRPIFCIKKSMNLKYFEEIKDCFILDFDPFESIAAAVVDDDDDNDVSVVAEKGQVACRDVLYVAEIIDIQDISA